MVDKFCYLGDMLDAGGSAESAFITRVKCGWKKFRELRPLLCSKVVSLKVKGSLFKSCVQTVLLYGSETWPAKAEDIQRLDRTESAMIRWMCGSSVDDNSSSARLRSKLGITPITELVSRGRLRWFGHVSRKDEADWLKRVQTLAVDPHGASLSGRPPMSWSAAVKGDLRAYHLNIEDTRDRDRWRDAIAGCLVQPMQHGKRTINE